MGWPAVPGIQAWSVKFPCRCAKVRTHTRGHSSQDLPCGEDVVGLHQGGPHARDESSPNHFAAADQIGPHRSPYGDRMSVRVFVHHAILHPARTRQVKGTVSVLPRNKVDKQKLAVMFFAGCFQAYEQERRLPLTWLREMCPAVGR